MKEPSNSDLGVSVLFLFGLFVLCTGIIGKFGWNGVIGSGLGLTALMVFYSHTTTKK